MFVKCILLSVTLMLYRNPATDMSSMFPQIRCIVLAAKKSQLILRMKNICNG